MPVHTTTERTFEDFRMKPAPITLIEYFATELLLATNHSFQPDKPLQFGENDLFVNVTTQHNDKAPKDGNRWQVSLEVRHQPGPQVNFPYSYRAVLIGQFGVAPSVQAQDEERMVKIQGASMLYSMAREIIRALTGRGPYRPVILPTVSFYEQKPATEASAHEESSEKPPAAPKKRPTRSKPGVI